MASQDELRRQLGHLGVRVTQATLSRDMRELRLVKTARATGRWRGRSRRSARRLPPLARALKEFLLDIRPAQNMLVLKTPPGGAQPLAAAVDSEHWKEVAGTLAGDDTVLVICLRRAARAARFRNAGGNAPMSDRCQGCRRRSNGLRGIRAGPAAAAASAHREADIFSARGHADVRCLTELFPQLRGWGEAPCRPLSVEAVAKSGAEVVFLSTPHEASLELVPALLAANPALRIVDLSGAFRFRDPETFAQWYKLPAPDAKTLGSRPFTACRNFMPTSCRARAWSRIRAAIPLR